VRNTSAIPLRAAYLHGPYTIHVAAYPSTFNPNKKVDAPKQEGVPEFEPNLKAGGSWNASLIVPERIRETGGNREQTEGTPQSATWIIEIASQIIFSQSASTGFELLVARDEKSLDLGFMAVTGNSHGVPGQVQDHQQGKQSHKPKHAANTKGVYSKAIKLVVDDTASLWNKPELPEMKQEDTKKPTRQSADAPQHPPDPPQKQKKIHLVILTHGLHSNLGADMLYLKESIDATARQAREDRRKRRQEERQASTTDRADIGDVSTAPLSGGQEDIAPEEDDDDDDEEVIVRGFDKNVIKTERGVQYLGKRLAKHVLELTYPDQPYFPLKKSRLKTPFSPAKDKSTAGVPAHQGSSIHQQESPRKDQRAYKFTSISFVGHSLGGVVQTYAIAYIYKHSPEFFEKIKPINFIAMASPFLGLSNENPMYVKFALDFGLVGRTGQDLGLTWRAPTLARSGWTAMVSGLGGQSQSQQKEDDPGSKPLLRILPSGPAHVVLRMFRNRTVYSNVVNDGIVPLRTSCLLFLDWRGLGKVEKARRENGLVGTVAAWGFGQLIGHNTSPNPSRVTFSSDGQADAIDSPSFSEDDTVVPQPGADVATEDEEAQAAAEPSASQWLDEDRHSSESKRTSTDGIANSSTIYTLWNYIRPSGKHTSKDKKMFTRSQTVAMEQEEADTLARESESSEQPEQHRKRPQATRGDSTLNDPSHAARPPKTTIFESASDLLAPPVPETSWIIDPSTRARTVFHDRIYHPEDIPPPPARKRSNSRTFSGEGMSPQASAGSAEETSGLRVEEKIARAYHKDLSWRKVLVRLEPDAHNNIIVRRMFANAYGWPVIKHLCDTHFADTYAANVRDEREPAIDRAKGVDVPVKEDGEHVKGQEDVAPPIERTESEMREVADELAPLKAPHQRPRVHTMDSVRSKDSATWDDMYFEGTSDEEDDDDDRNAIQRFLQFPPQGRKTPQTPTGTSQDEIADFLTTSPQGMDMHRGLGSSPSKPARAREPDSLESMGGGAMLGRGRQTSSPPQTPSANISGVGLRKSLDVSSPASAAAQDGRARSGSGGVAEQVARLSYFPDAKGNK
jgi:hypothetical protein